MPDTTTSSFDGFVCRDEITSFIANAAVTGAPFARAITPMPTDKGAVTWPRAAPEGFGWVSEGGTIPDVDLNDDSYTVGIAKLAGLVTMSSEFIDDGDLPMSEMLRKAVADSMGPKLDNGLIFGAGAPEPLGVLASAPVTDVFPDFRQGVINAWGELVDEGADPEQVVAFASGSTVAAELARTTLDGVPVYANGAEAMVGPGIRLVAVPQLSAGQVLVADTSGLYLVLRQDFAADFSEHAKFSTDQIVLRIKGRFACACPTPQRTLRRVPSGS